MQLSPSEYEGELKKKNPFVGIALNGLFALLAVGIALTNEASHAEDVTLDWHLIQSIAAKDRVAAESALKAGANPNAVSLGYRPTTAMCEAIDDRGTAYLQVLLDYGGSVNANTNSGPYDMRTPLACANYHYNPKAFKLLLELGADPAADLCIECVPEDRYTVFTEAMDTGYYPFALAIVQLHTPDAIETGYLVNSLEKTVFSQAHPWNDEREALIAWVKEQGMPINARPADPPVPGFDYPECIHSVREMEEGREKGSICE